MSAWFGRAGTKDALPDEKPCVWLITDPSWSESDARRVAAGCEEEGVPLAWDVRAGGAWELARSACLSSRLEVGIGIDAGKDAAISLVQVSGYPYVTRTADGPEELRWIGQAAARISKSQPVPGARGRGNKDHANEEKHERVPARGAAITKTAQPPASAPNIDIAEIVRAVMGEISADGQKK